MTELCWSVVPFGDRGFTYATHLESYEEAIEQLQEANTDELSPGYEYGLQAVPNCEECHG